MEISIGLVDIHYRACHDGLSYRGRKVTTEERDIACKEFEKMTGVAVEPHQDPAPYIVLAVGSVVLALIVGIIIGYTFGKRKSGRRLHKKNKQSKA